MWLEPAVIDRPYNVAIDDDDGSQSLRKRIPPVTLSLVDLLHDLRYAVSMFRKDAAFTLVAVLSLALGTGANSAMFSFVNGLLLRPLPVSQPGDVLTITPTQADNMLAGISYPDYLDFRDRTKTMKDLVAFDLFRFGFSPAPDVLPQAKYGLMVSGNLFQAMGVKPILGRTFRPDEDQVPGRDAVVVLGHDFWRDQFAGAPDVVGRMIRLDGLDFINPSRLFPIRIAINPALRLGFVDGPPAGQTIQSFSY